MPWSLSWNSPEPCPSLPPSPRSAAPARPALARLPAPQPGRLGRAGGDRLRGGALGLPASGGRLVDRLGGEPRRRPPPRPGGCRPQLSVRGLGHLPDMRYGQRALHAPRRPDRQPVRLAEQSRPSAPNRPGEPYWLTRRPCPPSRRRQHPVQRAGVWCRLVSARRSRQWPWRSSRRSARRGHRTRARVWSSWRESAHEGRSGGASRVPTTWAGKPSRIDRAGKRSRCLTHAPARTSEPAPTPAVVADDRGRLDHGAGLDVAAVDHRPRADDDVVLDDQLVVGQQVQHGVLQDLHPGPDAHRAVGVADDLDPGPDDGVLPDERRRR